MNMRKTDTPVQSLHCFLAGHNLLSACLVNEYPLLNVTRFPHFWIFYIYDKLMEIASALHAGSSNRGAQHPCWHTTLLAKCSVLYLL